MKTMLDRRGMVSISVMTMLLLIFLLGGLAVALGVQALATATEDEKGLQARYLAEAGIIYACKVIEMRRPEERLPRVLPDVNLLEVEGSLRLEIKENTGINQSGKETARKGHHLLKAIAAVKGAKRIVEAEVEETGEAERKVVLIMQREY